MRAFFVTFREIEIQFTTLSNTLLEKNIFYFKRKKVKQYFIPPQNLKYLIFLIFII